MSPLAEVYLWGSRIGAVNLPDDAQYASFQYDEDFLSSGIEVSPIQMPLADRVYSFPNLKFDTFQGLPGMLADSLPDSYGNAIIDAWLEAIGRTSGEFNAVERLCYTGNRGMGALEFRPAKGPDNSLSEKINVGQLVQLASRILAHREDFSVSLEKDGKTEALEQILMVGTSAGGARAKAVVAWNQETGELRSGQVDAGEGFEYWLLKFDGVETGSSSMQNPRGYGLIEYAYYKMATAAGITMSECRIFKEQNRKHFITKRYDRDEFGGKIHKLSFGSMAHLDYNMVGVHSYEQAFNVIRDLELSVETREQFFRRMVFNIVARNQDDHVKNIEFLMERGGNWSLAPAFDVTYSYNPQGNYAYTHQMTMNRKGDNFTVDDFKQCGKKALLKRGRAESIVKETIEVVKKWNDFAEDAGVSDLWSKEIKKYLRLKF